MRRGRGWRCSTSWLPVKIRDHQREPKEFVTLLTERTTALQTQPLLRTDLMKEMRRFLPAATVRDTLEKEAYWGYLVGRVDDLGERARATLQ